jgi:hypothetical protein
MYIRTKDAAGNWGITNSKSFFVLPVLPVVPASNAPATITKAEYFYDIDPGFGNGINIPISSSMDVSGNFAVDVSTLASGVHYIYVRTKDAAGSWSITNVKSFYVLTTSATIPANKIAADIVKAEYFVDADPGFGLGKNIPVTQGNDITITNAFIDISGLPDGVHHVYVRTQDAAGNWSITNNNVFSIVAASVSIPSNPIAGNITKFEYFFDNDPGFGNAHTVSVAATTDLSNFTFAADVTGLTDGSHTLYIRTYDDWGITVTKPFTKGAPLPLNWLSFNANAITNAVQLNWKIANEIDNDHFEIERGTDGRTFTKIGVQNAIANAQDYQFIDNHPVDGVMYYRIRQIDKNGTYKYSVIIAIRFGKTGHQITIYPNPANDVINILFDKPQQKNSSIQLFNNNGQLIQTVAIDGLPSKQINVSALPNGAYQIRITTSETTNTQKIIVQH